MAKRRIKKRVSPINLDQKFYDKDLNFLTTFLTEQGRITPRYINPITGFFKWVETAKWAVVNLNLAVAQ